jgi:hypothetical protein
MIDHVVLATDDLERTVAEIARDWGVQPTPGGAHVGRGTRNALVGIGPGAYLEIVGPDLDQADHIGERSFGVDRIDGRALVAWCARPSTDLGSVVARAAASGHDMGPVSTMSRRRPDGTLLEWRLTFPLPAPAVMPFVIDWLGSAHPTSSLDQSVELLELRLHSPVAATVRQVVKTIGGDKRVTVVDDTDSRLAARFRTPAGDVTLAS